MPYLKYMFPMLNYFVHQNIPDPPTPTSMMKGIVIMTLCAFYTLILFSCVAAVKTLAILVMGQQTSLNTIGKAKSVRAPTLSKLLCSKQKK